MTERTPPHDLEAESAILGAALISRSALSAALECCVAQDFYRPAHSQVFDAMRELHANGAQVDPLTVADELRSRQQLDAVGGTSALLVLQAGAPGTSTASVTNWAEIVAQHALRRRLMAEGSDLTNKAGDLSADPGQTLDAHKARLTEIDSPVLGRSPGDVDIDEFIDQEDPEQETVVPGLLNVDDRVIVVAPEGTGKSVVLRQAVVCVAHGIQPFSLSVVPAQPTMLVDLENPRRVVRKWLGDLTTAAVKHNMMAPPRSRARGRLWHRPGGIDLRKRSDRLAFEDVLRAHRPKLVALGPVYKCYVRRGNETDEQVAAEVQAVLDDLRTRYGFALVLEHHAPQIESGGHRELRPFGSSLWLRWPEYGLKLTPHEGEPPHNPKVVDVGRWRGDRSEARWPNRLVRSSPWPWRGDWEDERF